MITSGIMRQEIERLAREYEDTYRRRDFRAMANFYTEDATLMPAGQETVRGRFAIEQVLQALYDQMGVEDFTMDINAVESSGDLAYESGTATLRLRPTNGVAAARTIRYLVIWKRQATGQWQIAVDISNAAR